MFCFGRKHYVYVGGRVRSFFFVNTTISSRPYAEVSDPKHSILINMYTNISASSSFPSQPRQKRRLSAERPVLFFQPNRKLLHYFFIEIYTSCCFSLIDVLRTCDTNLRHSIVGIVILSNERHLKRKLKFTLSLSFSIALLVLNVIRSVIFTCS